MVSYIVQTVFRMHASEQKKFSQEYLSRTFKIINLLVKKILCVLYLFHFF